MHLTLFAGALWWSLFCYALLYVLSSFAIILTRKGELFVFSSIAFLMSCDCKCSVALPHDIIGWFAVCDCGIS